MKKINQKNYYQRVLHHKEKKRRPAKRVVPQTKDYAVEALQLSQKTFKKLKDIEDLIEMIAREIKRQLDQQK